MPATTAHLGLSTQDIGDATIALLPGDPERVPLIARQMINSKELAYHREFRSYLGYINEHPILVVSTGIGGPSLSICVEELAQIGVRDFIRVGSCGAIQEQINVTDVVISTAAVRLDGVSNSFAPIEYPAVADLELTTLLAQSAREQNIQFHLGITATCSTFYPGQERYDTFSGYIPPHLRGSMQEWHDLRVCNFEMEVASLFTMCSTMGLRAGAACGVAAKRTESEGFVSPQMFQQAEANAITTTIGAVTRLVSSSYALTVKSGD